jgi:hypothetical protein
VLPKLLHQFSLDIWQDLTNRTQSVVHRPDVTSALTLAKEWQQKGRADWFRGQVFPWPPHSSLSRWTERTKCENTFDTEPTLHRFYDWAKQRTRIPTDLPQYSLTEAISESNPEADVLPALTAIAQHFGIPTNYIDFSLSPDVAALFSRDRKPGSTYPSDTACIYCLNLDEMEKLFLSLDRAEAEELQLFPVAFGLPALHRLTAQEGVFLHAPGSWDQRFKPLCILFPRGNELTPQEHLSIYPPTSTLEETVQAFLQANSTYEWSRCIERKNNGHVFRRRDPAPELRDSCFASGLPTRTPSWPDNDSPWVSGTHRPAGKPFTIHWPRQELKMGNWMFAQVICDQLEQTLTGRPELWQTSLRLEISPNPSLVEAADAPTLSAYLTRAWNAMEGFPYSNDQRLVTLERLILLGTGPGGLVSSRSTREDKLNRMLSGSTENPRRWVKLTLGANNGACCTALASFGDLVDAFRSDSNEILSPEGRRLAVNDPIELMRRVRDPALLFDFKSLVHCMAEDLIPTQILFGSEELPVVFSPAQLNYLGPP